MVGDPFKIFKCETTTPKINLKGLTTNADFDQTRINGMADILKITK
jgi:hypothetical protein